MISTTILSERIGLYGFPDAFQTDHSWNRSEDIQRDPRRNSSINPDRQPSAQKESGLFDHADHQETVKLQYGSIPQPSYLRQIVKNEIVYRTGGSTADCIRL
jgi:hypothetical protein